MKIRLVGPELFRAGGQTEKNMVIVAFRNFVKMLETRNWIFPHSICRFAEQLTFR